MSQKAPRSGEQATSGARGRVTAPVESERASRFLAVVGAGLRRSSSLSKRKKKQPCCKFLVACSLSLSFARSLSFPPLLFSSQIVLTEVHEHGAGHVASSGRLVEVTVVVFGGVVFSFRFFLQRELGRTKEVSMEERKAATEEEQ